MLFRLSANIRSLFSASRVKLNVTSMPCLLTAVTGGMEGSAGEESRPRRSIRRSFVFVDGAGAAGCSSPTSPPISESRESGLFSSGTDTATGAG